jgi:DNA-binding response OmpR family regulator
MMEQESGPILIVDDDALPTQFIEVILNDAGYKTVSTTDPSRVLGMIMGLQPRLVLLDMVLPNTDGFAVLEQIQEAVQVPVIMLTAQDKSASAVRAIKLGAADYLTKPVDPSRLLAAVELVFKTHCRQVNSTL